MKIVITGGTGFIGRALVKYFTDKKHTVTVLTRNPVYAQQILPIPATQIIGTDYQTNLPVLSPPPDIVIHLAASLNYFGVWQDLYQTNVVLSLNLYRWAINQNVLRFVFVSSLEAIGTVPEKDVPVPETYACQPVSTYGKSKLEAEKTLLKENRAPTELVIARLANVFGPGSGFLVPALLKCIITPDPVYKYLPYYATRYLHPCYIDDAVTGIHTVSLSGHTGAIYHIAGESFYRVKDIFSLIAQIKGLEFTVPGNIPKLELNLRNLLYRINHQSDLVSYLCAGTGDRVHRAISIEKIRRDLGWVPQTGFEQAIRNVLFSLDIK